MGLIQSDSAYVVSQQSGPDDITDISAALVGHKAIWALWRLLSKLDLHL